MPRCAPTAWRPAWSIRRLVGADVSETQRQLRDGRLRLLYVSPEGPMQPGVLEGLALQAMEERAAILERDGNMPPGTRCRELVRIGSWQWAPRRRRPRSLALAPRGVLHIQVSAPDLTQTAQRILLPMFEPIHAAPARAHWQPPCLPLRHRRAGSGTSDRHLPRCGSSPLAQRPTSACAPLRRADRCR